MKKAIVNEGDFPQELRFTARTNHPKGQSLDSIEHYDLGNIVFHKFIEKLKRSSNPNAKSFLDILLANIKFGKTQKKTYDPFIKEEDKYSFINLPILPIGDNYEHGLSAGSIVALAGDFIGVPQKPIAFGDDREDKKQRFTAAFDELKHANKERASMYLEIAGNFETNYKEGAVHGCTHSAMWNCVLKAKDFLTKNKIVETITYQIEMTPSVPLLEKPEAFFNADYYQLLIRNFDHFGEEAKKAYLAGHRAAIDKVALARDQKDGKLLIDAILMELFACHYLTDLFAGGHIRTPRKELLNHLIRPDGDLKITPEVNDISVANLSAAGFFANRMHDEDGLNGVKVSSPAHPDMWEALGDGNYYSKDNVKNAQIACDTMMIALDDLFRVFCNQKELLINKAALNQYVPKPIPAEKDTGMFYEKDGKLHIRIDVDLLKQVKAKGLILGTKDTFVDGVPFIGKYIGFIVTQFFNVTLIPAVEEGKEKVAEAVEATDVMLQNLYNKLNEHDEQVSCTLL